MSTLSLVRSRLAFVNPLSGFCGALIASVVGFFQSLRLAIEVSGELDNANRLTARGKELLGIHNA